MTSPFNPSDTIWAYLRDSGGEEQDLSIAQQEQEVRAWCVENHITIARIYRDEARPGSSTIGRDAFRQMIRDFHAQPENVAGLIVWKYSRFARNMDDASFYRADLRRLGYTVYSLKDKIPPGLEGRFFEAAIDWMNQRYLNDLSADVKRGLNHIVTQYGCVPGTPPRGFRRVLVTIGKRRDGSPHICHRWEPDPEIITRVQQAFRMRASGASLAEIQRKTALYKSINSWHRFFRNELYIGTLNYADKKIENYCEPIVDRKTWQSVQKICKTASTWHRNHPRRVHSSYVLSGIAHCSRCNAPLFGQTVTRPKSRDRYYRCTRAKRRRDCDASSIPAIALEHAVIETLEKYILTPQNIAYLKNREGKKLAERKQELAALLRANRAEQRKLHQQLSRLVDAIATVGISSTISERITTQERRLSELETEAAELNETIKNQEKISTNLTSSEIISCGRSVATALKNADTDTQRTILRGLIHKIYAERIDKNTIHGYIEYYLPRATKKKVRNANPALMLSTFHAPPGAPCSQNTRMKLG